MKIYCVSWRGPYSLDEIVSSDFADEDPNIIYILVGKRIYERGDNKIQYIGISGQGARARLRYHHKAENVRHDPTVWIGHIDKSDVERNDLELAESVLVYFSQPPLNEKKTSNAPKESCSVISRYYKKNGDVYKNQKSYLTMLPDVLMWSKEENKLFYANKLASYDIE